MLTTILFTLLGFWAQENHWNTDKNGIAIEGYDPVSYFQNNPQEGSSDYSHAVNGTTFYFSSQKNLDLFRANTTKYLPKYGGWCAYAMAKSGDKVQVNPKTYKLINGELYLFYNAWGNNTLNDWNKKESDYLKSSHINWIETTTGGL